MSAWSDAIAALPAPYLWWKLDETSGTSAADSSGNGLTGTYSSPTLNQTGLIPGDTGKSVTLATTSGNIAKGSGMSFPIVGVTFAQTFKSSTDFTSGRFFQAGTAAYLSWQSTTFIANIATGQTPTLTYDPTTLCDGNPHLVVYVIRATTVELWVDGTMVASASHAASNTTQTSFQVKQSFANPTGSFDDVLIWSSALSSTQIGNLYAGWLGTAGPTVVTGTQATESDTALAGSATAGARVTGGQAAETDAAQAGTTKAGAVVAGGQASETDTGQAGAVSTGQVVPGSQATETDSGQGGTTTTGAVVPGGQATETDTGQGGSVVSAGTVAGGQAAETDTAQAGSVVTPTGGEAIDLSTFVDLNASTTYEAGTLVGGPPGYGKTFTFPLPFDAATPRTVEVDIEGIELDFGSGPVMADSGGFLYSALGPTQSDVDGSNQWTLDGGTIITGGTGTLTFEIGPGLNDWDAAVADGEHYVIFSLGPSNVTAIRISPPFETAPSEPIASDVNNDAHKLTLGGWGVATWEPAVVLAPATTVRHAVISAIAYGPVTMQGTQPVFTYSEADRPRLRQRILLGGRDATYDRDVPTPDVEFELADLLLYGPGTLDLPQYVAFAEVGTDVSDRWAESRRVKVQLVDDFTDPEHPSIEATVYKGFVLNPSVSGRNLSLELGGEAAGRLNLRDSHVLFREVLDVSRLIWRELTDVGVRYLPRLGGDGIGIKSLNFGGTGKREKVEELLARAVKKDGTQRAVLPDEDGAYGITDKDTETIHFTVFVDDAFTVPEVSSDLAEKPNSIYPTAIDPDGMRIDGAAVPGLISTPAPDYPMADNSTFDIGTTNEDTDSGDGISVMVNRLGAVGLLTVRETPGGFDEDVADALAKLQRQARLTGPVGVMTPALWRALWDLDATGRSGRWSSIQPTAQDPSVQRYLRSASGAVIGLNPDFDEDALQVDESIDMGTGFRERQVQNWSETRVHAPGAKVWYGTITLHLGAVLAGRVDIGATLTPDMLRDARLVQPGRHNLWVPNFDGGTLFGVSGAQVRSDSVVFTVDTRFRPAREIWERLQVRRETRNDPARRMLGTRQSTQRKDAVRGFISWGGLIDRDVPLVPGWNVIEVVVGDHGNLAWIETVVQSISGTGGDVVIEGREYALALFGKPITVERLNALVPNPLNGITGERAWRRRANRKELNKHGFLVAFGTQDEPCGYGEDIKSDGAPLTGRFVDDATTRYDCEDYRARLCVFVREGVTDAKLLKGRAMWPVLEGGV